tara:strand:- start:213 stop:707 length:495 start_codon:yes stop_codon:yes gene_type:complete
LYLEIKRLKKYVEELKERDSDDFWADAVPMVKRAQSLIKRKTDDGGGRVTMVIGDFIPNAKEPFMGQGAQAVSMNRLDRTIPHHAKDNISLIPLWRNVTAEWCIGKSEKIKYEWMQRHAARRYVIDIVFVYIIFFIFHISYNYFSLIFFPLLITDIVPAQQKTW